MPSEAEQNRQPAVRLRAVPLELDPQSIGRFAPVDRQNAVRRNFGCSFAVVEVVTERLSRFTIHLAGRRDNSTSFPGDVASHLANGGIVADSFSEDVGGSLQRGSSVGDFFVWMHEGTSGHVEVGCRLAAVPD